MNSPIAPDSLAETKAQLEGFVADQLGPRARPTVTNLERVTTGRSRENWLFDLSWHDGTQLQSEPLIVRRDPDGGLLETDRLTEFLVLQALQGSSLPTPPVRWLDIAGTSLGKPSLVMVRLPGACDYYVINGDRPETERVALARSFCDLLVDVHQVDWRQCGFGDFMHDPGPEAARYELTNWEVIRERDRIEPYPELVLAARWLRAHAPTSSRTVLVHADYKAGNILLDERDQVTALLDWELAHLGDLHEDLGWITQPLRTGEHLIPGAWEVNDLFDRYELSSGITIDRATVRWWNVFSSYKTAVMQASGLRSFVEGRIDELYLPSAAVLRDLLDSVSA